MSFCDGERNASKPFLECAIIVFLPPVFTLLLGHAFEAGKLKDVRAILLDRDRSKESTEVFSLLSSKDIFVWQQPKDIQDDKIDLSQNKLQAAIIIPRGWGNGLHNGGPNSFAAGAGRRRY